jgi:hypothetical protein
MSQFLILGVKAIDNAFAVSRSLVIRASLLLD